MRWRVVVCLLTACNAPPTYHQDVAPLLNARCVSCHQNGGIGPFALATYDMAKSLAPVIAESVRSRRMPPWGAAAGHREYLDNPSLSDAQIDMLAAWAESGAPEGDASGPVNAVAKLGGGLSRSRSPRIGCGV